MGCTTSSAPMDAQAMLEKQRELMLQRQKEFELKRQQQQGQGPGPGGKREQPSGHSSPEVLLSGMRPPVIPGAARTPSKTGSAPPSPATPTKPPSATKPAAADFKLDEAPPSPKQSSKKVEPPKTEIPKGEPTAKVESPSVREDPIDAVGADPAKALKYTVDNNDPMARRSKNIHDYSMYAKDVTRRPSFNPRPSESPFTPEMQAMMKAGHEAMMAAEIEKKQQRIQEHEPSPDKPTQKLPTFEDDEAAESKGAKGEQGMSRRKSSKDSMKSDDDEGKDKDVGEPQPSPPRKKASDENFALDVQEAKSRAEAERLESQDKVPDDPTVAKFVAKDNVDRRSKNIHDLGQYFNRRASFIPGEPGQQPRRMSFQPESANRRHSFLPNPAPVGNPPQ